MRRAHSPIRLDLIRAALTVACLVGPAGGAPVHAQAPTPDPAAPPAKPAKAPAAQPQRPQALQASKPVPFTSADGSRFVLLPDPSIPLVHWAIASWADGADDPPGLEGLALVTMHASLNGTWTTGSADPAAEAAALNSLDEAWQAQLQAPGDADKAAAVVACDRAAGELGDPHTFLRALAAMPSYRPEVVARYPVAVFVLTTTDTAIGDVGRLLLERRDQQALRGLIGAWMGGAMERAARRAGEPFAALHAEVLALENPTAPLARLLEPPLPTLPRRQQALATWAASQRPDRTVHVLLGDFDPTAARAELERVFGGPPPADARPRPARPPQPLSAQRRSVVRGTPAPMLAIAWVLPPIPDRYALEVATTWLGDGEQSFVGSRLRRAGQRNMQIRCRAPWPPAESGQSLFLLEISGPNVDGALVEPILAACADAAATPLNESTFYPANMALQRGWNEIAADPRRLAVELAADALLWPGQPTALTAPPRIKAAAVQQLLAGLLRGQPVIVEGRP